MDELVKITDIKNYQQGTRLESEYSDEKIHLPKNQKKEKALLDKETYEKCLSLDVIKIGNTEFKRKYGKDLRLLTFKNFADIFYNIAAQGIKVPVFEDEGHNVIDGWYRLVAASILKINDVPFLLQAGLSDEQKYQMAHELNALRRQMTKEEIEETAVKLRKDGESLRKIAAKIGTSHETVRTILTEAGVNNLTPDELPSVIMGNDGRTYPSVVHRKNNPSVFTNSVSKARDAAKTCSEISADKLPDKIIDTKRLNKIVSAVQNLKLREQNYTDIRNGSYDLLLGDFRQKAQAIEDESVDMIFTDPPYDEISLPLWNDLGILAKRVLKPGGFLLAYSGQMYLPQIIQMLGTNLEYVWPLAVLHTGHTMIVHTVNVQQRWKPVLWYCKPPFNKNWAAFKDICSGGEEKQFHEWGQAVEEARYYLKALCPKDAVVLDPMMGGATTVIAAKELGFKVIGIETDPARFAVAQQRLAKIAC